MDFESFLFENVKKLENKAVFISDRFSKDFIIKPITEEEHINIKLSCKKNKDNTIDIDDYILSLVCSSVLVPDLKNEKLQNSYCVLGDKNLIKTMLTAGEFSNLLKQVEDLSGFNKDIEKISDKIKN